MWPAFPRAYGGGAREIGTIESDAKNADFDSQQYRVYSPDGQKRDPVRTGGGVGKEPRALRNAGAGGRYVKRPGEVSGSQSRRIYSVDGKGVPLPARPNGGGADGAATGLYAVPLKEERWVYCQPGRRTDTCKQAYLFRGRQGQGAESGPGGLGYKPGFMQSPKEWHGGRGEIHPMKCRDDQKANSVTAADTRAPFALRRQTENISGL